jgi:drug/metabolite transporter (DMT)-like permease
MIPYFLVKPEEADMFTIAKIQTFTPSVILNLLFLGCVASMLCFLTWNWVIKKLGAVVATNYVYFNPVVTVIFAWLILSERITVYFLAGTLLILLGMFALNKGGKKGNR